MTAGVSTTEVAPRFAGKNAVVAGASGGVGIAVVDRFVREGGRVIAIYHSNDRPIERWRAANPSLAASVTPVSLDLTEPGTAEHAIGIAQGAFGAVDVLISTIGATARMEPFLETAPETMSRVVDIELLVALHLAQAAMRAMREAGGSVVFVGSDSGKVGALGEVVSAACRGGLIAMAKSLAREFARNGIRVNVVCPGPTDTPLWDSLPGQNDLSRAVSSALVRAIPMKRIGAPEEVAAGILYLASDDASYVTGQALSVSGGLTMA